MASACRTTILEVQPENSATSMMIAPSAAELPVDDTAVVRHMTVETLSGQGIISYRWKVFFTQP